MKRDPNTRVIQRPTHEDVVYKQRVSLGMDAVRTRIDRRMIVGIREISTTANATRRRSYHRPGETIAAATA